MVEANNRGFSKTCYYELLDVDRKAETKAIAKAYKLAALKWHPNKNRDRDTTEQFQQIQEAYACLSNDQERAWYDSHRDQILRGKDVGEGVSEDDCSYLTKSKLDRFMKSNIFAGFAKSEHGSDFYSVYGELFKTLDDEEELEEEIGTTHFTATVFGDENATKEEVYKFYKEWEGFGSIKKFAFVDVYDSRDAPNRRIKRLIENDNNRARNRERTKFNDKVRDLIAYVKAKDPRWAQYQEEDRRAREAYRQAQEEERRIKSEIEAEKLRVYREDLAEFYRKEEEEAILRGDVEEVIEEEFRCQMCKKTFKKEGQFKNHIQSKQHKKMEAKVNALREELQLDDDTEALNSAAAAQAQKEIEEIKARNMQEEQKGDADASGDEDSDPEAQAIKAKMNKRTKGVAVEELADVELEDMDEWTHKAKKQNKKKKNEKNKAAKVQEQKVKEVEDKWKERKNAEHEKKKAKEQKKRPETAAKQKPSAAQQQKSTPEDSNQQEESKAQAEQPMDVENQAVQGEEESKSATKQAPKPDDDGSDDDSDESEEEKKVEEVKFQLNEADLNWDEDDDKKKGKKKGGKRGGGGNQPNQQAQSKQQQKKGAAKASQQTTAPAEAETHEQSQPSGKRGKKNKKEKGEEVIKCNVCSETFPTRNKVMQHVKLTGHARAV